MQKQKNDSLVFAVDFDGTCTTHDFPRIGKDIGAAVVLRRIAEEGHKIILFTMRSDVVNPKSNDNNIVQQSGKYLTEAVDWFRINGIPLYGINTNPEQRDWTSSPKAYANIYIDDAALGCPLLHRKEFHHRPFVDWARVYLQLYTKGILTDKIVDPYFEFLSNFNKQL